MSSAMSKYVAEKLQDRAECFLWTDDTKCTAVQKAQTALGLKNTNHLVYAYSPKLCDIYSMYDIMAIS